MKKIIGGVVTAVAIVTPIATAASANAAPAPICTPSAATKQVDHTEYQWAALVAKPTLHWDYKWTATPKNPSTDIFHIWVKSLDLTKKGAPQVTKTVVDTPAKDAVTCSVILPEHFVGEGTRSVVVPFVKGVDTFLLGVPGYDEKVAITEDVTVTKAMAGQFWIGHEAQPGYVIANPTTAQWHIDFGNNTLWANDVIKPGEFVSTWNNYRFVYQGDGNLVLYGPEQNAIWDSHTWDRPAGVLVMQGDGNLVIYPSADPTSWSKDTAVWNSETYGHPGAHFVLQNNGVAQIVDTDDTVLWQNGSRL